MANTSTTAVNPSRTRAARGTPDLRQHASPRELTARGFIRAPDGYWLDNRDGFWDHFPRIFEHTYDPRTFVAVPRLEYAELRLELATLRAAVGSPA